MSSTRKKENKYQTREFRIEFGAMDIPFYVGWYALTLPLTYEKREALCLWSDDALDYDVSEYDTCDDIRRICPRELLYGSKYDVLPFQKPLLSALQNNLIRVAIQSHITDMMHHYKGDRLISLHHICQPHLRHELINFEWQVSEVVHG